MTIQIYGYKKHFKLDSKYRNNVNPIFHAEKQFINKSISESLT